MKNKICVILLGVLLFSSLAEDALAQSRRQRRKDKERLEKVKQYRQEHPQATDRKPITKPKPAPPKKDFEYPQSVVKDKYRIDVLAPLYLSELVQDGKVRGGRLPDKVMPYLKFYEGLLIATDTLKKLGYKIDIFVYDVSDELESPATLVNTDAFAGSDMILGILSSNDFPLVANYARKHNINFVSALSPSNQGVTDNPYFTMLQPSLESHCSAIEGFIYKKYGNISPILMYRSKVTVDSIASSYFWERGAMEYRKLQCDVLPERDKILPMLVKDQKNIILVPILSDKYAESMITKLYEWFPDYEFEVWGMPSWDNMASLKKSDAYPNVVVYFTNPYHFDPTTASGQAVVNAYKKKFGGKPDNMVFRGYETMFWYSYLLKKYGNIFNVQLWDNGGAPFTRFDVKLVKDAQGKLMYYENKHVYLYRYHSASYMVEQSSN